MPSMTDRRTLRIAGWAGLIGVALGGLGSIGLVQLTDFPGTQTSPAKLADFIARDSTKLRISMLLNTAAISLWLVLGAGVWQRVRRRDGLDGFLSACFGIGLVSFVTLLYAGFTAMFLAGYRTHDGPTTQLLVDLTFGLLAISGPPTALALGSYAALVFRGVGLPRWTAWLAIAGVVTHVLLLLSLLVTDGFFSLEGQVITAFPTPLFLWVAGTGIALLAEGRRATAPVP
jgi:hypothetical protein